MTDLIQRIEAAKEPRREFFEEAALVLIGTEQEDRAPSDWPELLWQMRLDAQAWTSAAEMLFHPRELSYDLDHQHAIQGGKWNALVGDADDWVVTGRGSAAHPSLALLAGRLRAERKDDHG